MNIMLTDIRSLTLDMQEIPVVDQGTADSFQHVLRQQLPTDAAQGDQVAEFKEFFMNSVSTGQASEMIDGKAPMATWRDYLSQQQIRVTTDSDPVETIAVDVEAILPTRSQPLSLTRVETVVAPGEALPVGGNSLPDDIFIDAQALPKDIASATPRLDAGGSVAVTASADSRVELLPGSLKVSAQAVHKVVTNAAPGSAGTPVNLAQAAQQPIIAQAVPINPADDQLSTKIRAANASHVAADVDFEARVDKSVVAMRETAARPQMPDESQLARLARDSRSNTQPVGVALTREFAVKEMPLPRELSAAIVAPAWEMQVNSAKTAQLQAVNGVESAEVGEMLNPARNPAQPVKVQADATAAEFVAGRGSEMPQQVSQAQPQPAPTALSSAAVQGAANSTVASPAAIPNPLPAQLETMSLARGADATEWGNGLGDRVGWMINQKQNSATIRLDPPMLGKLDVQVKIADDATTITIQTQHAQTRELIESASLRLRDFLQESGYQNVNVDVSQRQDQQQARAQSGSDEQIGNAEDQAPEQESVESQHQQTRYFSGDGIVDTFA